MNLLNFPKYIRVTVLTLCLVVLLPVMSANAQNSNSNMRIDNSNTRVVERNDGFDWSWLGLLGLLGLSGLLKRDSPAVVHRVDNDATRR